MDLPHSGGPRGRFGFYMCVFSLSFLLVTTCELIRIYLVLSSEFRWDHDGVDILGGVDIHTGNSFIQFPLNSYNLKFLHRTTSIAV